MDIHKAIDDFMLCCSRSNAGSCFESYSKLAEILLELNRERLCHRERLDLQLGKIETLTTMVDKLEKAVYHSAVVKDEDLKPCPFCGSSFHSIKNTIEGGIVIGCSGCAANTGICPDMVIARGTWNRRSND